MVLFVPLMLGVTTGSNSTPRRQNANFLHPYISELYYRHVQEDGSVLDTADPTVSIWSFLDIGKSR